jgi:hypothetical protein
MNKVQEHLSLAICVSVCIFQTVPCTDYQISWKAMLMAGPRLKRACPEAEPFFPSCLFDACNNSWWVNHSKAIQAWTQEPFELQPVYAFQNRYYLILGAAFIRKNYIRRNSQFIECFFITSVLQYF